MSMLVDTMSYQSRSVVKVLSALLAVVISVPSLNVSLDAGTLTKCCSTEVALVGFAFLVNPLMSRQALVGSELV